MDNPSSAAMSDHNTTVSVLTSGTATSQVTVQSSALRNILAELIAGVNRHEDLIAALQTRCTIPVPLLPDSTTHPIPDTELRWRLFSATVVALQEQIAVLREQQAVFMSADRTGRSVSYYQRSPIRSGSPVTMMATTTAGAGTSSNRMWLTTASLQELEGGGGDSKPPVVTPEEKLYKKLERTLQKELHDLRQRVEVLDNRVSSFLVASLNSVSNLKGVSEDVAHLREEHQISQKESERSFRAVTQKADAACKSAESVARDLQQVHALADSLQGQLKTLQSAVAAQQKAAPGLTRKESMALKAETTKEVKDAEARWNKTMESKMGEVRHELTALRNVADAAVKRASVVTPSSPPPTPHSPSTSRPQQPPPTVASSVPLSPAAKDSDDLVRAELTKLRLDMAKAILDHELTHHRHQLLSIPAAPNANSALLNGGGAASASSVPSVAAVSGSKNGTVPPPGSSPVGAAVGNPPGIPPLNNQVNASSISQGVVAGKPFTAAPPLSSSSQSTGGGGGGGTESMISRAAPPKGGPSSNVDTNDRSSSGPPPPAVGERTPPPPPSLLVQQQQQPSSDQPLMGGGAAPYATKVLYGAAAPSGAVVTPRGAVRPQSAQPMRGRPLVMTRSIVPEDSITSSSSAVGNVAVYLGSSPRQPPPPPSAPNHTALNVSAATTTADRTVAPSGGGKPTRPLSAGVLQQASLTFKLGKASTPSSTTVVGFAATSEGGTTSTPQRQAPPASTAVANSSPIHQKAPTIRPTSAPAAAAAQTGSVEAAATTTNGTSSSSAGAVGLSFVAAMPPHEPGTCVVYKCHYCKDK